jgi:cob(I)alamin adenosyltransferase
LYKEPNIKITKVYTKSGDKGNTKLVGGQSRLKSDLRIDCYGEIDELNSNIGACIEIIKHIENVSKSKTELITILIKVQNHLFNLGTMFATLPENMHTEMPKIELFHIKYLESQIDKFNKNLKPITSFVLPGGSKSNISLHLARTICRRVERKAVKLMLKEEIDPISIIYLNRLSDALFVWSRWIIYLEKKSENYWNPNK